ncbi:uncharacterized protein LOC144196314 isoform X3 [Stigmatopora nigra]
MEKFAHPSDQQQQIVKVEAYFLEENTFILLKTVPEGSATCWSKTPPTCGHGSRTSLMVANIRRRLTQDQSQAWPLKASRLPAGHREVKEKLSDQ